jgi:hypothetical protein
LDRLLDGLLRRLRELSAAIAEDRPAAARTEKGIGARAADPDPALAAGELACEILLPSPIVSFGKATHPLRPGRSIAAPWRS